MRLYQNTISLRLGRPELRLLRAVHAYDYLTAEQATRLHFSRGSLTYVQAKLKALADDGYLIRLNLLRLERTGTTPLVYAVSGKGRRLLEQLGVQVGPYRRPSEEGEHSYLFLAHSLAVSDVLIAAALLPGDEPRIQLVGFRGERSLKHTPVPVRLPDGSGMNLAPDAWLEFRTDGKYQDCLVLELDRGTEYQEQWRRKVAAIVSYASGPYQEAFGVEAITVAVATTAGAGRLKNLIEWTERELARLGRSAEADLFCFTAEGPARMEPAAFFLGAHWHPTPPLSLESEGYG